MKFMEIVIHVYTYSVVHLYDLYHLQVRTVH